MDGLIFLKRLGQLEPRPIFVVYGSEEFLRQQVTKVIRKLVLKTDEDDFGMSAYEGEEAAFATIHDELETLPFVGSKRLIIVENADTFVTQFRSSLEKYFAQPSKIGTLLLQVRTWPRNTRLAKMLDAAAAVQCDTPPLHVLPDWCMEWASARYGKTLTQAAARHLVDLIGPEMGQLDQELQKLAIFVGSAPKIDVEPVEKLVGNNRFADIWRIFDAIGAGRSEEALEILDCLFDQGQEPIRILGAFSMQLRRLAQAGRLVQGGLSATRALERAGVQPFALRRAEEQLRHLGPQRLSQLYDWLLEIDLGLKGSSQLPPRILFERLVLKLAHDREEVGDRE